MFLSPSLGLLFSVISCNFLFEECLILLSGFGDVAKQVPEGCAEPFGNRGQEDGFGRVHGLWGDIDNGLVRDGHGKDRIVAPEPVASWR